MTSVLTVLSGVDIGESRRFGRLDVFPLSARIGGASDFLLLDEALAARSVEVTETSETGSVPVLELRSTADVSILILDGEELVGAKQNRILNTSVVAPAGKTIQLPVSCVEQGRWRYMSRTFEGSKHTLFAKARARKAERMAERFKASPAQLARHPQSVAMAFDADQGAIWADVSDKLARMKVRSASVAMKDGFDSYEANLSAFEEALAPLPGQTGAVFALDGRIAGAELLPTEAAFRKLFRKLVRSYAIDALEEIDGVAPPAPAPPRPGPFWMRLHLPAFRRRRASVLARISASRANIVLVTPWFTRARSSTSRLSIVHWPPELPRLSPPSRGGSQSGPPATRAAGSRPGAFT